MIIFSARYCFLLLLLLLLLSETTLYDDEWLNRLHNIFQTFFFYASVFFFRADFIQLDRLHQFIGERKVYIVICIYTNNCVKQIVFFLFFRWVLHWCKEIKEQKTNVTHDATQSTYAMFQIWCRLVNDKFCTFCRMRRLVNVHAHFGWNEEKKHTQREKI